MHGRFKLPRQTFLSTAVAFLLSALLAACASVPEQLTQAALEGNAASLDGLLKPGSSEVNVPVSLKIPQPACPGLKTLTPLQAAACAGQESVVRKLLAGKADIDLALGAGQTPLMLAMAYGRDNAARVLIESGARLEYADAAGNTPLLIAAQRGNRDLAELLLKNGASPKVQNNAGETALLLSTDVSLSRMLQVWVRTRVPSMPMEIPACIWPPRMAMRKQPDFSLSVASISGSGIVLVRQRSALRGLRPRLPRRAARRLLPSDAACRQASVAVQSPLSGPVIARKSSLSSRNGLTAPSRWRSPLLIRPRRKGVPQRRWRSMPQP